MKRFFAVMLVLLTVLSSTACNGGDGGTHKKDRLNAPSEKYIVAALEITPNITVVASATINHEDSKEDESNGCYAAVFFCSDLVTQETISKEDLLEKGIPSGGCIEAYRTVEDARKRVETLSKHGDKYALIIGHASVEGTLVIRISGLLDEEERNMLKANVLTVLTEATAASVSAVPLEKDKPT